MKIKLIIYFYSYNLSITEVENPSIIHRYIKIIKNKIK